MLKFIVVKFEWGGGGKGESNFFSFFLSFFLSFFFFFFFFFFWYPSFSFLTSRVFQNFLVLHEKTPTLRTEGVRGRDFGDYSGHGGDGSGDDSKNDSSSNNSNNSSRSSSMS